MIAAIVAPAGVRSIAMMRACLVSGPAASLDDAGADRLRDAGLAVFRAVERVAAFGLGEDSSAKFKALWGLYYYSMTSGRLSEADAHADELLGLAQRLDADDLVLEGH